MDALGRSTGYSKTICYQFAFFANYTRLNAYLLLDVMRLIYFLLFAFCVAHPAEAQTQTPPVADALLGRWYVPSRQSTIEFFKTGDRYFARITEVGGSWQKDYADAKGRIIISNLRFTGSEWAGGELIHPGTKTRFDVALSLPTPNTVHAIAYKSVRFLHKDFKMIRQMNPPAGVAGAN
ncbi:MAG: DUF2147 domain-containing protein [Cytophagales bacterium]|nr:MAG: DUF2147 domain-containing protein [Cytophagales bacterium]